MQIGERVCLLPSCLFMEKHFDWRLLEMHLCAPHLSWGICEILIPRGITSGSHTKQRIWLVVARLEEKEKGGQRKFASPRSR